MSGPLDGVRIVDLTTVLMGPYATQILADMGAEVVKVESPEGDVTRQLYPYRNRGMGFMYLSVNRNKRSIVLDLKKPEARDAVLALAKDADVLVYNIRPAAMARLKLSYEDMRAVNPRLLYVGAFGYSQRGPNASKPAYEDLIQGAIGLPRLFQQQGSPEPHYVPINLVDRTMGQQVAGLIAMALYRREKTGRGERIDVPMFEHMLAIVLGEHMTGATFEPRIGGPGYARILAPERRPFRTRDGYVCVLIYNDKQWRAFFSMVGRPEVMETDERFSSADGRSRNTAAVNETVAAEIAKRTTAEWLAAFDAADIPAQRMNDLEDILADEHLAAIGYYTEREHPTEGRIRTTATPSEWSESQPSYRRHAPTLGQHTREVLREAGYDDTKIDAMLASGAARGA